LCYGEKKLIGSAQYRSQGYLLQHGSVLFSYNEALIDKIFNEKMDPNTITCMKEINPDLTRQDVAKAMKEGFEKYFNFVLA
jgi:lipoate-protein ligase A